MSSTNKSLKLGSPTTNYHNPLHLRRTRPIFLILSALIVTLIFYTPFERTGNSRSLEINQTLESSVSAQKLEINQTSETPVSAQEPKVSEEEILVFKENPVDWKFNTSKHYQPSVLFEYGEAKPIVDHSMIPGNGENGSAFTRVDANDPEMQRLQNENNYNLLATEMMSLHRSLPDYRCDECKQMVYSKRLPKASIILIFHDEAWTLILRSVWSIIERSPRELIEEIILVDDVSTWPELHRPIEDYIELLPAPVRLIRTQKREGLIRARLIGAESAKGQVLVLLDAHIEVTAGWLEPLLANIAEDRSLVAVPHIDWISSSTLQFEASDYGQFSRYSWRFGLYWSEIPERELIRTNRSKTALIRLPMHVGCAFAIDRDFFYEIGSYDEGMEIWGSENLELALRAWMCGGSLQLVQCSRIGHFYRTSTYSFEGDKGEILARNDKRVAEVWMDDDKELLYAIQPGMITLSAGDLTDRKKLREHLQCKSFRWYLANYYPESRLGNEFIAFGQIQNLFDNKCMDTMNADSGSPVIVYRCHNNGGNQFIAFTKDGLAVTHDENRCIGAYEFGNNSTTSPVLVADCTVADQSQQWQYSVEEKTIRHIESGLCMQSVENQAEIVLGKCDTNNTRVQWSMKNMKQRMS